MAVELLSKQAAATPDIDDFRTLAESELCARIASAKAELGQALVILGHHYQKDEVIGFADFRGDSLKLSQQAADCTEARFIIFCGVHFMAETADVLTDENVAVILPDMAAGCSMADMADIDQVEACWEDLGAVIDTDEITPVTYVNSTAALKAFCGRHDGIVCTSSNAAAVLRWAFERRPRVLFFPDQHLGRNTAKKMGIPLDQMAVWNPLVPNGGLSLDRIERTKVLLWRGWCSVHQMFKPEHVALFRQRDPQIKILVHPECMMEVVDQADVVGSTESIIRTIRQAAPGTKWAVGTELHLVNRLKHEHTEQEIHFLSPMVCMCATMYRIDLPHLCWAIENLANGVVVNRVSVPPDIRHWARVALDRMLLVR
jgi:quinolinate synthase